MPAREWLRLSNALALRNWPTTITTVTRAGQAFVSPVAAEQAGQRPELAEVWASAYEAAAPGAERDLVVALAGHEDLAPPAVGAEGANGIPTDLSWSRLHVAVEVSQMAEQDRADLSAAGWTVLPADVEAIVAELHRRMDLAPAYSGGHG